MENLFQLRKKNDQRLRESDEKTREQVRSMTSYVAQYEQNRYDLECFRNELLDKMKQSKTIDSNVYCDNFLKKKNLNQYSLKNFFLVSYIPMILFFFVFVLIVIHFLSTFLNNTGLWMSVDITLGYPVFMIIQYFSIVFLLYLERRYSLENKSKKNIASFANIFIVLTVIQFISENELLSSSLISVNLFILVGILLILLAWTIQKERQTK
jgi:Flp pilus assembly protein TadB